MLNLNSIWVEKYRPTKFEDMVLSSQNRKYFLSLAENKDIPHLLFCSKPGMGKTTAAKIIANHILQCQYIYINASDENGIDVIRNRIIDFAQTKSFDGNFKVIILDEFDGCTIQAQRALRNVMEEYAQFVRFILTANNKNNIIPAIQSRCISIDFEFEQKDVILRCLHILKNEGIEITKDDIINLAHLVKSYFPDIRKTINALQRICVNKKFEFNLDILNNFEFCDKLWEFINTKSIIDLRKFLIENEDSFNRDFNHLLSDFLNYVYTIKTIENDKKVDIILIITEFLYKSSFMMDLEINTISCFYTIYNKLKK